MLRLLCICALLGIIHSADGEVGCRDNNGNPVDWFVVYKLPKLWQSSEKLVRDGVAQAYLDAHRQEWTMLDKGIDKSGHAVYNTLEQIYKYANSDNFAYVLYNDEPPLAKVSYNHGHTKGDLAFDQSSGFWLIHSVPKFPPQSQNNYSYPKSGMTFGQSFLCITFGYNSFNDIGGQLLYNYPKIYDYTLPSAFAPSVPQLAAALNGSHINTSPLHRVQKLTSSGGQQFISFAKCSKFGEDLYHDLVASYFNSDLLTETWQNGEGRLCSNCSEHKVQNILRLSILNQEFRENVDHSKWAMTNGSSAESDGSSNWICIGDINRMKTQWKRAGGTVCINVEGVWNSFRSAVRDTESCEPGKSRTPWKKLCVS